MNDRAAKIAATHKERKAAFANQTIEVGNWRIIHADTKNWEVQFKGQFRGYYGRLIHALQSLPAKMLDEPAQTTLTEILQNQQTINKQILELCTWKLS